MTEDKLASEMAAIRASLDYIRDDLKHGRETMKEQTKSLQCISTRVALLEATDERNKDMPRAVRANEVENIKATARTEAEQHVRDALKKTIAVVVSIAALISGGISAAAAYVLGKF